MLASGSRFPQNRAIYQRLTDHGSRNTTLGPVQHDLSQHGRFPGNDSERRPRW
jgi:hypothetical protein